MTEWVTLMGSRITHDRQAGIMQMGLHKCLWRTECCLDDLSVLLSAPL